MRKAIFRKIPLIIIGVFCVLEQLIGQERGFTNIEWNETRPLVWKDYPMIKLRGGKKGLALTSVKHSVVGKMENGGPDFDVKVYFIDKDSWTTDSTNQNLLAHEQLHFDIGELYRRKIQQKVKRLRDTGEKQKAIYRYAIKKLLSDFRIFSREYDKVTRHGTLSSEQQKWKNKVGEELNRLHL